MEGKVLVPPLVELQKKKEEERELREADKSAREALKELKEKPKEPLEKVLKELPQEEELRKFKERIQGKVVLLYGAPWVGKSLFSLTLSKLFSKVQLFLIDLNYPKEFFQINPNLTLVEVRNPKQMDLIIHKLPGLNDQILIIDSITNLFGHFITEAYFSPRAVNAFNNFSDRILNHLSSLTPQTTSIVICHERISDWEKQTIVPRINKILLRNIDMLVWMREQDGQRIIKIVQERTMPKEVKWRFE